MTKLFYTFQKIDSHKFLHSILADVYQKVNPSLTYSAYGKPYLEDNSLYFNLSHSGGLTVLAVSEKEIGVDCEKIRARNVGALMKRLTERERRDIHSQTDFFAHWTAKESYVKFLGSSLARDLKHLEFYNATLYHHGEKVNAHFSMQIVRDYFITVCSLDPELELIPC